jgi:hypothetical protein
MGGGVGELDIMVAQGPSESGKRQRIEKHAKPFDFQRGDRPHRAKSQSLFRVFVNVAAVRLDCLGKCKQSHPNVNLRIGQIRNVTM